jgi:hypothetical protein
MVHGHSRALVTTMLPEPPEDGNELTELLAEIAHLVPVGEVAVADVVDELQALANPRPRMVQTIGTPRTTTGRSQ